MSGAHAARGDYDAAKLGMWLFLATEILLFGGLFIGYSYMRSMYPLEFHAAGQSLNHVIGIANTFVLLTSSLTMALAVAAIRRGERAKTLLLTGATAALGLVFLTNKGFEWAAKIHHGIYPGSAALAARSHGEQVFFGLYYTMTGLHGAHVLAGVALLGVMSALVAGAKITGDDFVKLENAGLYWHLVDVIWIFLLPLFYLAA